MCVWTPERAIPLRFRCLKLPSRFHRLEDVDPEFRACVVLYNMCHFSDGRENRWDELFREDEEITTRLFGEDDDGDMDVPDSLAWVREWFQRQVNRHANMAIEAGFDASGVGIQGPTSGDLEVESGWSTLQAKLVRHFKIATDRREVSWLF